MRAPNGRTRLKKATQFPDPSIQASKEPTAYVGDYCNDVYGKAAVTRSGDDGLRIKFNLITVDLRPAGETRFFIPGMWAKSKFVDFQISGDRIQGLHWQLEESSPDAIRFERCDN